MKSYFTKINWVISWFWLKEFLDKCSDWMYKVEISKQYKIRSLQENKYYFWVVLKILSDELWYEVDEVHELMKERFLTKIEKLKSDKRVKLKRTKSTSELTTQEFEEYLENIRVFASKYLNIIIPLPNQNYE